MGKHAAGQSLNPDQAALVRTGEMVRSRLAADPSVYRVPTEGAEVWAVGEFLSEAECTRMMALIDSVARPSTVYSGAKGPDYRSSYSGDVDREDPFVMMIERRIDDLVGLPHEWGETVQGQRYAPGQQFQDHNDWFHTTSDYWNQEKRLGGQRSLTTMVYLNDVAAGGSTDFPKLGISIAPQRGALLIWNNARPDGTPNEMTLHAGRPVVEGTKYIVTKWYRTRKWGY